MGEGLFHEVEVALQERKRTGASVGGATLHFGLKAEENLLKEGVHADFAELQVAAGDLGEFEQVVDEHGDARGGIFDVKQIFLAGVAELIGTFVCEDGGIAGNLDEGTAEIVGDGIGKSFELFVAGFEFGGALVDAALQGLR